MPLRRRRSVPDLPGQGRPKVGTKTEQVWTVADDLHKQHGRLPDRHEVVSRYTDLGGVAGTAETHYYHWRKARLALDADRAGRRSKSSLNATRLGNWLPISPEGHLVIPPDLLVAMRLDASREVLAEVTDGELRLISAPVALEQVQRIAARYRTDTSIVDELIADRRAEAARE